MEALQYVKGVPRYLAARILGPHWGGVYTSGFACLRRAEVGIPVLPDPRWVRVRPRLSGICGSDIATLTAQGSPYFSPFTSTPFIFGHEVVGIVEETGAKVQSLKRGDRVVLEPLLHCRIRGSDPPCPQCAAGTPAHCENPLEGIISAGIQTGFCRDTGGGWSENLVAHEEQLHAVPEGLPDSYAVLVEPFSCCLHAARTAALTNNASALVLGCGTMGLLTIAAARALGFKGRILASAKYAHQKEFAQRLGADEILPAGGSTLEAAAQRLGARTFQPELGRPSVIGGADVCFDCVGSSQTIDDSFRLTRSGGRVVMVGMPSIPKGVDWTVMWHKELQVLGSYAGTSETFREAIRLVAASGDLLKGFVGAIYPLARYREAISGAIQTGRSGVIKTVFQIPAG